MSGQPLLGQERWFWVAYAAMLLLVLAVGLRSITMAVVLVAVLGGLALLAPTFGTKKGTLRLSILLLVTVLVLPDDMALKYRIPVGGGGIFIMDILLALLVVSWAVHILSQRRVALIRSPVTLPLVLFLLWVAVSGVNGDLSGNDAKVIFQDARGLICFVLFLWVVTSSVEKSLVYLLLRVLAGCMAVGFVLGLYGLAAGQGTQLTYVEAGVSRFPAPNEVFVMSAALLVTLVVMWPGRQRRPWYLWLLLFGSLVAVLLAFVRGYWIGLAVGLLYLLSVGRTQQRLRLVVSIMLLLTIVGAGLAVLRPAILESVVTRGMAVGDYRTDPSIQYRLIENREVTRQIEQRPVIGNGLGKSYIFDFSRYGVTPFAKVYIHNNYLWFAQRMGLIGLGLFAWMMAAFLFSWHRLRRYFEGGDPWLVGLIVGSRVMIVSLLVISISSPQFNVKGQTAVIAVIMGLAEMAGAVLREPAEASSEASAGSRNLLPADSQVSVRSSV